MQYSLRMLGILTGILLLLLGTMVTLSCTSAAVLAQQSSATPTPTLDLPRRPTLTPNPPTAVHRSHSNPTSVPLGRITGTVIDLTSGAPAPGIIVIVGDITLTTDSNGNYDRSGLPPGAYTVALSLASGQGTPAQTPVTVDLAPGATVIQHLAFRSLSTVVQAPKEPATLPTTGEPEGMWWLLVILGIGLIGSGVQILYLDC
jgi:hypothetical protein